MNEHVEFARTVAGHIAGEGATPPSDAFYDQLLSRASRCGQRPTWQALIKEPPMRVSSRVAVGSPTARVAYLAVVLTLLALLAAGTVAVGVTVLGDSRTILVDASGNGDAVTITEGIALAVDGDTVLVRPGTYPAGVLVDKDITIRGDGIRDQVVVQFDAGSPSLPSEYGSLPYGFLILDSGATVRDLSVVGPDAGIGFALVGGTTIIERVRVDIVGPFVGRPAYAVGLYHDAAASVDDCDCTDSPIAEMADLAAYPDIRGTGRLSISRVRNAGIWVSPKDGSVISDNTIAGVISIGEFTGIGSLVVSGNDADGIDIWNAGTDLVLRGNTSRGGGDTGAGIAIRSGTPLIEGNVVRDSVSAGILLFPGVSAEVRGNVIEDNQEGIRVDGDSAPIIEGNRFCGNDRDLVVPDGSTLTLETSNTVCAAGSSPSP